VAAVFLFAIKAVWALASGSIALGGDAIHSLTDVLAYGGAYFAAHSARRMPTQAFTYGYGRSGVLAALGNAVLLVALAALVAAGAVAAALAGHDHPAPGAMLLGGVVGLAVALGTGLLLRPHGHSSVNRRAAFLHAAADALSSAGVAVAAVLIALTGIGALDAAAAVAIAIAIAASSWGVVRETVATLMEGAPAGLRVEDVAAAAREVDGVRDLHHVHVWRVDEGIAMSGHVVLEGQTTAHEAQERVEACARVVAERFGIGHSTLQAEIADPPRARQER
jgi:cobalt-zinc-cadmium efflux system protein